MYEYKAKVASVYDGDTLTVDIDLGFDLWLRNQKVRVAGIDTPEVNSKNADLRTRAIAARDRVRALIPDGSDVTLVSEKYDPTEKYGRILAKVRIDGLGIDLATELIEEGFATPYSGGKRS